MAVTSIALSPMPPSAIEAKAVTDTYRHFRLICFVVKFGAARTLGIFAEGHEQGKVEPRTG